MTSFLRILLPSLPDENVLNVFKMIFFHFPSTVLRSTTLLVSEKRIGGLETVPGLFKFEDGLACFHPHMRDLDKVI